MKQFQTFKHFTNHWAMSFTLSLLALSSCDTKNLNSIAADRVGGNNTQSKVVAGAKDFMIVDVRKTSSTASIYLNKKFTENNGHVNLGIYTAQDCSGTELVKAEKINNDLQKDLSISKLNLTSAYVCAWELSKDESIRNAAINNGYDLNSSKASSSGSSTGSGSSSGTSDSTFASSLHLVTNGATTISLGWLQGSADSSKIASYQLYRSDDSGVTFTKIQDIRNNFLAF